jgi:hypothetical protein
MRPSRISIDDQTEAVMFDRAIDEILLRLGNTVLTLAHPEVTRTADEKAALVKSVNQFAVCAANSRDERVTALLARLEAAVNSHLPGRLQ